MPCCCLKIYTIGCVYGCSPMLHIGVEAPTTGIYTLRYDYLGLSYTTQINFAEDEEIIFELIDMAFTDYICEVIKPDGTKLTLNADSVDYDCFRFTVVPEIINEEAT